MSENLVKEIQSLVNKHQNTRNPVYSEPSSTHPLATHKTPSNQIGVILDAKRGLSDLIADPNVFLPDNLSWISINSYKDFKSFIDERGIPAYITFSTDLNDKDHDGVDCAKYLINKCKKLKLKEVPQFDIHHYTITKKKEIEMMMHGY